MCEILREIISSLLRRINQLELAMRNVRVDDIMQAKELKIEKKNGSVTMSLEINCGYDFSCYFQSTCDWHYSYNCGLNYRVCDTDFDSVCDTIYALIFAM